MSDFFSRHCFVSLLSKTKFHVIRDKAKMRYRLSFHRHFQYVFNFFIYSDYTNCMNELMTTVEQLRNEMFDRLKILKSSNYIELFGLLKYIET